MLAAALENPRFTICSGKETSDCTDNENKGNDNRTKQENLQRNAIADQRFDRNEDGNAGICNQHYSIDIFPSLVYFFYIFFNFHILSI